MPAGQARKRGDSTASSGTPAHRHRAAAAESRAARDRTKAAREERRTHDAVRRDRGHGDEPVRSSLPHPALADGYGDTPPTEPFIRPADELLERESVDVVRGRLADLEHERWSGWMAYLFSRCEAGAGGELIIPAEWVRRWRRQVETPYADLTEREQASDLEQVDRYWPVLERWIRDRLGAL